MSRDDRGRWRQIEEICATALEIDPAARDAYLDNACGDDRSLRREVAALLAHDDDAGHFLDASVGAIAAGVMTEPHRDLIGRALGDYEITGRLGEGGMGEVYRGRDRKLGREVAIKVLPAAFANDAERLKRFEREARFLATVNHPGIGAIYGLIEDAGVRALILELIDGETLAATLSRGPLSLARALSIGAQIADALDHAHRRGITHRDLKPSNVMLTATGVKLLDFGVGKWAPGPGGNIVSAASTLTGEGVIVGTLHYMAPEQLEGKETDARSDLFAFGAVLYEMLTGRKAFDGPSNASIIAAVMDAQPPRLTGVGGPQTSRLERVVNKCLAKHPDQRWQSARDLGDELRWVADDVTRPAEQPDAPAGLLRAQPTWVTRLVAALAVAALGTVSWDVWQRSRPAPAPTTAPVRFEVHTPPGIPYASRGFGLSGDGTQLAFADNSQPTQGIAGRGIWIRRFDRSESYLIPDTAGARLPRFSPDAQWIAYVSGSTLRRVRVSGDSTPQVVVEGVGDPHGLTWTPEAIWISSIGRGLQRVSADGGAATEFTAPTGDVEVDHHSPFPLPGGRHLLLAVHGKANRFSIAVQALDGSARKTIVESGYAPVYSPTGHLVFGRGNSILAAPFDLARLEVTGPAVPLVERVGNDPSSGWGEFSVSGSGALAYVPQQPWAGRTLTWMAPDGRPTPIAVPAGAIEMPRLSPDGAHLAFVMEQADVGRQIWTYEFASGRRLQVTRAGDHWAPLWTKDGQALIFAKATAAGSDVIMQPLQGGEAVTLGRSANRMFPGALTPDGRTVILTEMPPTDEYFLSQLTVGQPGAPQRMPIDAEIPNGAKLSPDGRWMAFVARQGGRLQIFVQSYPPAGPVRQVTVDGGRVPVWSRDGRKLFYRVGNRMFAVSIDTARGLTWTTPHLLFEANHAGGNWTDYDVAPNNRFVMIARDPQELERPHFNVVLNWRSELLSRVPIKP